MKKPDKRAPHPVRPLSVERLEERIAPAGGIFAWERSGLLFIEGDELGNDLTIDQEGLAPGFDCLDVLDNGNLFGSVARDVSIEQIV